MPDTRRKKIEKWIGSMISTTVTIYAAWKWGDTGDPWWFVKIQGGMILISLALLGALSMVDKDNQQ